MNLSSFPELKKLPNKQKLRLADELWQAVVSDSTPLSAEQRKLLDSRWRSYQEGTAKRISMIELERRVKKK